MRASVLLTGGTGSLGSALARELLASGCPRVCVYSRGEHRQAALRAELDAGARCRWFIGDVRDRERMRLALRGVDVVIHAAALKRVEVCEENPLEAVATNVTGTANVALAAIEAGVGRLLLVSSDKGCDPHNLYGATKHMAEGITLHASVYVGAGRTRFAVARYGNVLGSAGSVVPLWREQAARGEPLTLTDPDATRFWITMPQAVAFVLRALDDMRGGEVFVPILPAGTVADLAEAVAPGADRRVVGLGRGEKKHEVLISMHESRHVAEDAGRYVITAHGSGNGGAQYASNSPGTRRLTVAELRALLAEPR